MGKDIEEICLNRIRRLADECWNIEGFIVHHSISGGTGSGFGSRILEHLSSDYSKKPVLGFALYPSGARTMATEPYNSILSS